MNIKRIFALALTVVTVTAFSACGKASDVEIYNPAIESLVNKPLDNDYEIKDNVVVYTGEDADEDPAVVQYAKPEKGELIAKIKLKGYGTITVKFFPEHAPLAVENFVQHVKDGYYNGVSFHRIIDEFMIQGGDPTGTGSGGESIWKDESGADVPFEDEYSKYLMPIRGALCMANSGPNTNGSQFFIVQATTYHIQYVVSLRNAGVDDDLVDYYKENGGAGWLYEAHTVFGQVVDGYNVLDKVAAVEVDGSSRPAKDVIIQHITLETY